MPAEAKEAAGARPRNWAEAFGVYLQPRVISMVFLGFSAGLPFLLVFNTLSAWLAEEDVSRVTIGFASWIGTTYSIKFLWAPVLDHFSVPFLTAALGKRRSWMLLGQIGIVLGLFGISFLTPAQDLFWIILLALFVAFSSATQDVVIDAYRIEAVSRDLQGAMSASYIFGYRVALLAAGAGALYLADFFAWSTAYLVMAALGGVGILTTLLIREPEASLHQRNVMQEAEVVSFLDRLEETDIAPKLRPAIAWLYGAVVRPFIDFFRRYGWLALIILVFIGCYRLSDITMGVMANPFYIDIGFSKSDIASISKVFGFFAGLAGAFIGGVLVVRYGILRPLLLGATLVALTNLLFVLLAQTGPRYPAPRRDDRRR